MVSPVIAIESLGKAYAVGEVRQNPTTILGRVRETAKNLFHRREPDQRRLSWAFRDVSFSVARGQLIGLIGSTGAGKSTLLRVLNRVVEPTHGQARLHGRVVAMLDAKSDFDFELTARDNIFFRGAMLGMTRREIRKRFDELVDFSGLGRFLDTPIKRFSLGMTTHLSFAIASHLDAEIMLIDEVFSYAGPEFREKSFEKLQQGARSK